MTPIAHRNDELNQVLVNILRSLLQYVAESWPWTEDGASPQARQKVDQLVARQRAHVERIRDLLYDRHWPIDFGMYPAEYTDLHYLALDYLLRQLAANQQALVESIERTLGECEGDDQAAAVVREIVQDERDIARELQALASSTVLTSGTILGGHPGTR